MTASAFLTWQQKSVGLAVWLVVISLLPAAAWAGETKISISGKDWYLNGQKTYAGSKAEGRLMNVRMVNAVFEDTKRSDFDADANTEEFIGQLPDYVAHGVRAFTLCLQGGMPGYEDAVNSAFQPDGSLRDSYLRRVERVITACDRLGAAVILGCFYQRQDQILRDDEALRAAVKNTARWIQSKGFTNVVLEISNEYSHRGFDHAMLKKPAGQVELIQLARASAPGLLVSTSGLGGGRIEDEIARASDFLLIHFNNTPLDQIASRVDALHRHGKPVVCNEDVKVGAEGAEAARISVAHQASWGLMHEPINQRFPFTFQGAADDPAVYAAIAELTGAPGQKGK